MGTQTRFHRPQIGMIRFSLIERLVLLFRGRLYFVTCKPIEISWTIKTPEELRAEAAQFQSGAKVVQR